MARAVLKASAELIEDYHLIARPPITEIPENRFCVVQTIARSYTYREIVCVDDGGDILLYKEARDTPSGWILTTVPVLDRPSKDVKLLRAFYDRDELHVLVVYATNKGDSLRLRRRRGEDDWTDANIDPNLSAISSVDVARDHMSGKNYVYGLTQDYRGSQSFFVMSRVDDTGQPPQDSWFTHCYEAAQPGTSRYHFCIAHNGAFVIFRQAANRLSMRHALLQQGAFDWNGPEIQVGELTADKIEMLGGRGDDFLILTAANGLQRATIAGGTASLANFLSHERGPSPGSAHQLGICTVMDRDSRSLLSCICILDHEEQRLWVRRLIPASGQAAARFGFWAPLGYQLRWFDCLHTSQDGIEIYGADTASRILHIWQSSANTPWRETDILVPMLDRPEPYQMNVYCTELVALQDDRPKPLVAISITSDRPTAVIVDGVRSWISPSRAVAFATSATGRLRINVPAESVSAPVLYASAPALHLANVPITLDDIVHRKLAGLEAGFPVDRRSLAEAGLLAKGLPDADGDGAAEAVRALGAALAEARAAPQQRKRDTGTINTWRFTAENDKLKAVTASATPPPAPQAEQGWLDVLWADAFSRIKSAGHLIAEISFEIGAGVVRFGVRIGGILTSIVAQGAEMLGEAITWFMRQLARLAGAAADTAGRVLEFVKEKFGWDDVAVTHDIIKHAIRAMLSGLDHATGAKGKKYVQDGLRDARVGLTDRLARFKTTYGGRTPTDLLPSGTKLDHARSRAPREAFVFAKLRENHRAVAIPVREQVASLPSVAQFGDTVLSAAAPLLNEMKSSGFDLIKAGLDRIVDLLQAAIEAVLNGLGAVLDVLMDALHDSLALVRDFIEAQIDVPVLTWLYKRVTGSQEFSLLDAAAFALAIPATLSFKAAALLNPGLDFSAVRALRDGLAKGDDPWKVIASGGFFPSTTPAPRRALTPQQKTAAAVNGVLGEAGLLYYLSLDEILCAASFFSDGESGSLGFEMGKFITVLRGVVSIYLQALFYPAQDGQDTETRNYKVLLLVNWLVWCVPAGMDIVLPFRMTKENSEILGRKADMWGMAFGIVTIALAICILASHPPGTKESEKVGNAVNLTSGLAMLSAIPRQAATLDPEPETKAILLLVTMAISGLSFVSMTLMFTSQVVMAPMDQ